jgi:hypothetical protein
MPLCQTRSPIQTRLLLKDKESRAERYLRLALAETNADRAKILWQLVEEAERNLLCTSDGARCADEVRVDAAFIIQVDNLA